MRDIDVLQTVQMHGEASATVIWRVLRRQPHYAWSKRMDVIRVAHRLLGDGYLRHVPRTRVRKYRLTERGVAFTEHMLRDKTA